MGFRTRKVYGSFEKRTPGPNKLQEPQTNAREPQMFSEFVRVGPPLKTSFLPSSLHHGNKVPSTHN